jgi:predicted nucleic acid-binding protein
MIAIDTSVLVDYIGDGPAAEAAEEALRLALSAGPVVACEIVVSEVVAGLGHSDVVMETLDAIGIGFSPLELRAAVRAGEMQRRYKERIRASAIPAAARRTVPDFLIGAHALLQCQGLITRDAGFYRDYFKGLKVIVPKA